MGSRAKLKKGKESGLAFCLSFRRENGLSLEISEKRVQIPVHVLNIGKVNPLCYVSK